GVTVADALHRIGITGSEHPGRDVFQLTRLAGLGRSGRALTREVLRRTGPEDLEGRRRAVLASGIGQPVAIGEDAPVALVTDDGRANYENVAVPAPRYVADTIVGEVHGVAAEAGRHVATDAVIAAAGEGHAGHVVLG